MRKGKLGISLTTYAVVSFVLALFGQMLLCALVLAVALIVEKDEWTSRQCMTAFFLTFANGVIMIIGGTLGFLGFVITAASFGRGAGILGLFTIIPALLYIAVLVFEIIGLVNVSKNKESGVPIFSALSYRAFGYVQPKQPPMNYNPGYPQAGQPYQGQPGYPQAGQPQPQPYAPQGQPVAPSAPMAPAPAAPASSPVAPVGAAPAPSAAPSPIDNQPPMPKPPVTGSTPNGQ